MPELSARDRIVLRAARELRDGMYVNLGIGMPTLVANHLPPGVNIVLESENGLLGIGPFPYEGDEDADLINAGKQTITELPGSAYFSSSESFEMIRGGHIDLTIMGGMEVSERGDLANWMIPGKMVKGPGGGMDLVASAKRVVIIMSHCNKHGEPKILKDCALPLTGVQCVSRLITEHAVFDFENGKMILREIAEGTTVDQLRKMTGGEFQTTGEVAKMQS
ncbi:MAG: CoA transferase subunit B [Phycisphaerales bacterium]|nr:CoA transferase subunit B [Phycisphaerales bacterium]